MTMSDDPFALLGLEPTLDPVAVKRAYFAALARYPPHEDPVGFQRLRRAYESLTRPGALEVAYLVSPVDVRKLADEARARFDAALEKARDSAQATRAREELAAQFQERCSRLRWEEVLYVFARPSSPERGLGPQSKG
ncbi:J domain-containing protein [Stigmatella sp. ncwal1]|uniref:J domain-containing protein n=1 Tax=Stigmatella ashevillensis TaxID=2995309 RepID=A0ABT5DK45_9BACT|nr:J domain-containing protein [Stigmatella ashevillena]MDC0713148.1 J domain-containing protein [Stigmatella ashevillena]